MIEEIKKQLKTIPKNEVMVRKNRLWKGLEEMGRVSYSVYYTNPSPRVKEAITEIVESFDCRAFGHRVVGGKYGYVMTFVIAKDKVEK